MIQSGDVNFHSEHANAPNPGPFAHPAMRNVSSRPFCVAPGILTKPRYAIGIKPLANLGSLQINRQDAITATGTYDHSRAGVAVSRRR